MKLTMPAVEPGNHGAPPALVNFGGCGRCGFSGERIRSGGEDLCESCMDAEMKVTGIDILVQMRADRPRYVINTARDAGTVFLPDGYVTGTMAAERRSGR